jgi:DNA repair photolyase
MKNPVIYTPKGAAREYAAYACNVYKGCSHGCSYCFGPGVTHAGREQFLKASSRGPDFLDRVEFDAKAMSHFGKISFQVHLCFTTDPYQPIENDLQITRETIQILHKYGLTVAILTKAGTQALRDLDLFGANDAMAATMTYAKKEDSEREEPCAALPQDRWDALKKFHAKGVPTWISCEPVMDPRQTLYLIEQMYQDVDLVKVGKLNHDPKREALIDWRKFGLLAINQLEKLGYKRTTNPDDTSLANAKNRLYYIKKALSQYVD